MNLNEQDLRISELHIPLQEVLARSIPGESERKRQKELLTQPSQWHSFHKHPPEPRLLALPAVPLGKGLDAMAPAAGSDLMKMTWLLLRWDPDCRVL